MLLHFWLGVVLVELVNIINRVAWCIGSDSWAVVCLIADEFVELIDRVCSLDIGVTQASAVWCAHVTLLVRFLLCLCWETLIESSAELVQPAPS